jgi:hypothetical protein
MAQLREVVKMHLPHARHTHDREQGLNREFSPGFFARFPRSALFGRFAQFHETGGQCPFAFSGFNVSFAQKNLITPNRHGAHHVQRVLVMHYKAGGTNGALSGIAIVWQSISHGSGACFTKLNRAAVHGCSLKGFNP